MIVSEIFRSLQGEGKNQGRPCTFVRLAGCNLRCAWCDTSYAWNEGEEMSVGEVLDRVWLLRGAYICITGGEPLLQREDLLELLKKFKLHGYSVEIETNGSLDFREMQPYASICMDVKCPSSGERSDLSLLSAITAHDSVKFVVADMDDLLYARAVMGRSENLPVRFQVQLHKVLGMR